MNTPHSQKTTLLVAWTVLIFVSLLPKVIVQEVFGRPVTPDEQALFSLAVILIAFAATLLWRPLRGLWQFLVLLLVFIGAQWLVYNRIDQLPIFRTWLHHPSFSVWMLAEQLLNFMVLLAVIAALLLMRKKPREFYLALGDISAPAEPIRWLGVKPGERWNKLGLSLTIIISLGTLAFLVIAGRPPLDILRQVLPFLPAILLAAAMNALYEEITYKAAFLSVLEGPLGGRQALYMVAVYFGIAHFYGVPYGVIGMLLAGFMGWLLAKSMQETRGSFWAWFIHFWQDVWIFCFLAIGSIVPGGG